MHTVHVLITRFILNGVDNLNTSRVSNLKRSGVIYVVSKDYYVYVLKLQIRERLYSSLDVYLWKNSGCEFRKDDQSIEEDNCNSNLPANQDRILRPCRFENEEDLYFRCYNESISKILVYDLDDVNGE